MARIEVQYQAHAAVEVDARVVDSLRALGRFTQEGRAQSPKVRGMIASIVVKNKKRDQVSGLRNVGERERTKKDGREEARSAVP